MDRTALNTYSSNQDIDFQYRHSISSLIDIKIVDFIAQHINLESLKTRILETTTRFNVDNIQDNTINDFINLKEINSIKFINKFFESVNNKLPFYGCFIGCVETSEQRKKRILNKAVKAVTYPIYTLDFFFTRVLPKCNSTRKLYYAISRRGHRVLSLAEVLGRLVCCGFEIEAYEEINGLTYFAAKKVKLPTYDMEPSYGPFFRMRRVGKEGRDIYVFKMRTMHPYSEYLQEYVYKMNSLKEGGKFNNDFRITTWGKYMRKFWIDELPMLVNILIGDMKLVGVRPLSPHYLNLYKPDLRIKRMKNKPGLLPPYYADLPKTLEEIMESEERYLEAYENHPVLTDIKYFFKIFYNIFIKHARSA